MNKRTILIKEFFGLSAQDAIKELRALTDQDKSELASAIARQRGLSEVDCDFAFVAY